MSWIALSIFAGFAWAVCNMTDKIVFERWKITPNIFFILISIAFFLTGVAAWAYIGFPILPAGPTIIAVAAGISYFLCFVFYYRAVAIEEVSRVVPLWYLSPLFILLFATLFLGERLQTGQIVGVLLLVCGAVAVTSRTLWIRPRWNVVLLMIAADLLFAMSAIAGKYLLSSMDVWTLYAYTRMAGIFVIVPALVFFGNQLMQTITSNGPAFLGVIAVEEVFNAAGDVAWLAAVAIGSVTLATALTSLQPFFVYLFCLFAGVCLPGLLNENRSARQLAFKFASIALMFGGVLLIT